MSERDISEVFLTVKAGGRSAFDQLQRQLEPAVRRFVQRLVGFIEAEDEIIQEAFLALYLNRRRLQNADHVRPFLFKAVRHRCYDWWRRKKRVAFVPLDGVAPLADPVSAADEQVHWSMLQTRVQAAMERLPEAQRQTLILHFEENLTYEQVAAAMGVEVGTVKSRIFYGRKNLRDLLGPQLLEALDLSKTKSGAKTNKGEKS